MIELTYKDQENNIFNIRLDRKNKKLWEASKKTKGEYVETGWNRLFDPGKERIQDMITSKMNDEDLIKNISYWMGARFGYKLIKVSNGN